MTALRDRIGTTLRHGTGVIALIGGLILFPFAVSIVIDGAGVGAVFDNATGNARFMQGLAIEVFILALYAMSYDLVLGVTGLLSFGHAMFFGVGAYTFGIALKTFDLAWGTALVVVVIAALLQSALFAVVLPRVKGITFALVTLGFATMFWIIIQSSDLADWAGAEIGLQGVKPPAWFFDTTNERFVFYLISAAVLVAFFLIYRRLVDSPTGRVLVAIRDNEDRAAMLGFNTFWFKFMALAIASVTAAMAGVLHTLHQPIVTPNVAGLGFMVTALLVVLIGGLGTVNGAIVGAVVFRLLDFYLEKWFGGASTALIGTAYVAIVLYLPFGIVGTWRARSFRFAEGRARLVRLVRGGSE